MAIAGANGSFRISYPAQARSGAVFYLVIGGGPHVRLASVLGSAPLPRAAVVNERTTVAMGFALAQFISGREVVGPPPGPQNAALMAANLVDPRTGALSRVLQSAPNGSQTSALRTFNSLANMLVPCVSTRRCGVLFGLATPAGGPRPEGTLAAVADIAPNPSHTAAKLFALASAGRQPYRPALSAAQWPPAWTLALRFDGDGKTMNGPGNMAIDARGNVWVTGNYTYSRNPRAAVCGSKFVFKFTPSGTYFRARRTRVAGWTAPASGSRLTRAGTCGSATSGSPRRPAPISRPTKACRSSPPLGRRCLRRSPRARPGGYSQGGISWPQGTVSDRQGIIWIANCGNDTVTRHADGNPNAFKSLTGLGMEKPFDVALNLNGQAFVTGNGNSTVAMLNSDGTPARSVITGGGLNKPLGIAADSHGNMWVANSGVIDIPCPGAQSGTGSKGGSITLLRSNGTPVRSKAFTGGGLTIPWGIAVDGNDNVWVANFGPSRLSEFCGVSRAGCPAGTRTGQPISPPTGYSFNGLTRNTGVQIDPSGNVWWPTTGRRSRSRTPTPAATRWSCSSGSPSRCERR